MSRNEERVFYNPHEPSNIDPPAKYAETTCCAHGCPLPGAFSDSTLGSNSWRCWIHETVQVADWQLATQVVRDNAWVVAVLNVVASWPPGNLEWVRGATKAAELMSRTDLAPREHESLVAYCRRLRHYLTSVVLARCQARKLDRPAVEKVAADPWKQVKALVGNRPAACQNHAGDVLEG